MNARWLSVVFGLVFLSANAPKHAIYISVIEISKEANETRATLSLKVFSNDLQDVIRNYEPNYLPKRDLEFVEANKQVISDYFNANLSLKINDQPKHFRFEKSELEGDAYFIYFSFDTKDTWLNMEVKGAFFSELFPDQSNILKINQAGKSYHGRLTKSNPSFSIIFD